MRLAYGVPLLAATYEAYADLIVGLASAMSDFWPVSVADMDIPTYPPGLPIPSVTYCVAHGLDASSGCHFSKMDLCLRAVTERVDARERAFRLCTAPLLNC